MLRMQSVANRGARARSSELCEPVAAQHPAQQHASIEEKRRKEEERGKKIRSARFEPAVDRVNRRSIESCREFFPSVNYIPRQGLFTPVAFHALATTSLGSGLVELSRLIEFKLLEVLSCNFAILSPVRANEMESLVSAICHETS